YFEALKSCELPSFEFSLVDSLYPSYWRNQSPESWIPPEVYRAVDLHIMDTISAPPLATFTVATLPSPGSSGAPSAQMASYFRLRHLLVLQHIAGNVDLQARMAELWESAAVIGSVIPVVPNVSTTAHKTVDNALIDRIYRFSVAILREYFKWIKQEFSNEDIACLQQIDRCLMVDKDESLKLLPLSPPLDDVPNVFDENGKITKASTAAAAAKPIQESGTNDSDPLQTLRVPSHPRDQVELNWRVVGLKISTDYASVYDDNFRVRENDYMQMFNLVLAQALMFLESKYDGSYAAQAATNFKSGGKIDDVFSGLMFNPKSESDASLYLCFRVGVCRDVDPLFGLEMSDIYPIGFSL
ncbi:MAG: hypothetical protein SGCHY_004069, partial [Lobulomycetales sp.]